MIWCPNRGIKHTLSHPGVYIVIHKQFSPLCPFMKCGIRAWVGQLPGSIRTLDDCLPSILCNWALCRTMDPRDPRKITPDPSASLPGPGVHAKAWHGCGSRCAMVWMMITCSTRTVPEHFHLNSTLTHWENTHAAIQWAFRHPMCLGSDHACTCTSIATWTHLGVVPAGDAGTTWLPQHLHYLRPAQGCWSEWHVHLREHDNPGLPGPLYEVTHNMNAVVPALLLQKLLKSVLHIMPVRPICGSDATTAHQPSRSLGQVPQTVKVG